MASYGFIDGHARRELFSRVSSSVSQGGSADFGQFQVDRYSRFTGYILASSVGNTGLVFRHRFAITSGGPFQISSATTISSGNTAFSGSTLDLVNFGRYADFAITSTDSTTVYSVLMLGEPLR